MGPLVPLRGKTMRQTCHRIQCFIRAANQTSVHSPYHQLRRNHQAKHVGDKTHISINFVKCVNLHFDIDSLLTQTSLAPRPPDAPSGFHTIADTHAPHSSTYNLHPTVPWFGYERSLQLFHPLKMTDGVQGYTFCVGVNFDKQG